MISLIVYGRNDNHGYNLHKRAALSLNCFAEVLDDPDDEIIFVDYNTPNDFPTFPEAIQDTLTAKAKALVRVLRARPSIHERFRARTKLAVAEPVARNIALRRSNAANAWVLSTNTDMLFLPRTTSSLSRAVADLPAGLYHTPRFELPETFWESFDRLKPEAVLGDLGRLARMAHLNEIVHASPTIVFDGPGDFQLARRDDLFAIDGFDERMLIGWHVDANLAARFALRGQPAADLSARVLSYHCDHTRQSTAAHTSDRVENDPVRFVDCVSEADIPEQRDSWGCPHEAIEEIRLREPGAGRYVAMLESVLPAATSDTTDSAYRAETFGTFVYRPAHVLPFLMDMLVSQPPGTRLGWCGGRRDMFDLAAQAWTKLGFRQPILVETENAVQLGLQPGPMLEIVGRADWIERADILLFEFGLASHSDREMSWRDAPPVTRDDAKALFSIRSLFLAAAKAEQDRCEGPASPRLFIGVNCIHNASEEMFASQVAANATPFSTHVRHGFVAVEPPGKSGTSVSAGLARVLHRSTPIGAGETALLRSLLLELIADPRSLTSDPRVKANATALIAALRSRAFTTDLGLDQVRAAGLVEQIERARSDKSVFNGLNALAPAAIRSEAVPLTKVADYGDWDCPTWAAHASTFRRDRTGGFDRDLATWEQAHFANVLARCDLFDTNSDILVAATMPDRLVGVLSLHAKVTHLQLCEDGPGRAAEPHWCVDRSFYDPSCLDVGLVEDDLDTLTLGSFDAVVFPHHSLFSNGTAGAVSRLAAADRVLKVGGIIVFKAEISSGAPPEFGLHAGQIGRDGLAAWLQETTGYVVDGGALDIRVSEATLDRVQDQADASVLANAFLRREPERAVATSIWVLRKRRPTEVQGWAALHSRLSPFPALAQLRTGAGGLARPRGGVEILARHTGHVVFGPYVALPQGAYSASIDLDLTAVEPGAALSVDMVDGETKIAAFPLRKTLGKQVTALAFDVGRSGVRRFEIRLHSSGGVSGIINAVTVTPSTRPSGKKRRFNLPADARRKKSAT